MKCLYNRAIFILQLGRSDTIDIYIAPFSNQYIEVIIIELCLLTLTLRVCE